ncbi:lactonase family protein [Paenibacillus beijingensis]|uniref:lactonase family protein n=1 Tax=Paenibacillus beijingensis TaxID=1126833 RepID=UPI00069656B2|nr:lactonase family protein [Paenibacillus beijingensis]
MATEQKLYSGIVYIGCYGGSAEPNLYVCGFDETGGTISIKQRLAGIEEASFLAVHPDGRTLYAVSETAESHGEPGGSVYALSIAPGSGELELIGDQLTHGEHPCFVSVSASGNSVYVCNYSGSTAAVLPIDEDGGLLPASQVIGCEGHAGPNPDRQEKSHPHSIRAFEGAPFVYIADLGTDSLHIYKPSEDGLSLHAHRVFKLAPGSGPRHAAFHRDLPYAYVLGELDSSVAVLHVDRESGTLTPVQTVSSLPEDFEGVSFSAEVALSPCGRFLYVSNRGHDSIAVFSIAEGTGELTPVEHVPSGGQNPRHFALSPDGRWLLAANQGSDAVIVFQRDPERAGYGKRTASSASASRYASGFSELDPQTDESVMIR